MPNTIERLDTSGWSREELDKYEMEIKFIRQSENNCRNCNGLANCKQDLPGWRTIWQYQTCVKVECGLKLQDQKRKQNERLLKCSRIPATLKNKRFKDYQVTPDNSNAYNLAKSLAKGEINRGLVLTGGTGSGKTHLAAAIMNYRLKAGKDTVFCTVPELLIDIRRAIALESDTTELIEIVKNTDMLILDDLGAERPSEWVVEQLFVIINSRFLEDKLTVVTSNYNASKLIARMSADGDGIPGQRIISRLKEMCIWTDLGSCDRRVRAV